MKNLVAFLLCMMMVLSLFSCRTPDQENNGTNDQKDNVTPDQPNDGLNDQPTDNTDKLYYKIEKIELTRVKYYIYDFDGNIVLSEETDRPLDISMLGGNIIDICIGMGTGISIHKYYDVQSNRFSEEYTYVAATSGNLVAYIDTTSMKDPMNHRKLVVRDIFDAAVFYKSFRLNFSPTVHDPIESASFSQGEMDLKIVYQSDFHRPFSVVLPIRHNIPGAIYASEAEKAMNAFSEVLKNDIAVHEVNGTTINSDHTLKDIKTPYNGTPLGKIENLKYIYLDMDGDYVKELIIDCGDILVLRYYEGHVYVYPFTFRNMYSLKTDGSYSWNHTGQNFEYGENKLAFDGVELKGQRIWRIVNDGEPNTEYYIGDKKVTREEMLSYFEDNPKIDVELTALETTWKDQLSADEALEIAKKYWKDSCDDEEEYEFVLTYKFDLDYSVYVFLVRTAPYTPAANITEIWIDKYTGEIVPPDALG